MASDSECKYKTDGLSGNKIYIISKLKLSDEERRQLFKGDVGRPPNFSNESRPLFSKASENASFITILEVVMDPLDMAMVDRNF